MDLEAITLCEINQTQKDKNHVTSLICGIEKTNEQIKTKQKKTYRYREQTDGCQKGRSGGMDKIGEGN